MVRLALGFVFYGVDQAVLAVERSLLRSLAPVAVTAPAPGGALDALTLGAPGLPELFYALALAAFLLASASAALGGEPLFESTPPPGDDDLFVLSWFMFQLQSYFLFFL